MKSLLFDTFAPLLAPPPAPESSKSLRTADLIAPPQDLQARQLFHSFQRVWDDNKKKNQCSNGDWHREREGMRMPVLWSVLHELIFWEFWYAGCCRLVSDALVLVGPVMIELVVRAAQESDKMSIFYYSTILLLSSLLQAIFLQQFIHSSFLCGAKVTNTATTAVYQYSLKLKLQLLTPPKTIGEINNIQSKDASSLREFVVFAHNLWSCPLTILGCVFLVVRLLGFVGLVSVVILTLFIPIESYVADLSRLNKKNVSKMSDLRMSLIYELIDGIKTLKLTGLVAFISRRISVQRDKELNSAWNGRLLDASNLVISRLVPVIVISLTFGLYLFAGAKLDAPKVFATLSVINIMARPISVIPKCISLFSGCLVSLKRIEDLIRLGDIDDGQMSQISPSILPLPDDKHYIRQRSESAIKFSNVTVPRLKKGQISSFSLKNLNCTIQGPGLTMIAGDNGSGKTTFLQAVLREVPLSPESEIKVIAESERGANLLDYSPRIAYCGHDSWIIRETVKRNIILGDPEFVIHGTVDEERYQSVLDTCDLRHDILQWPHGDMTFVGEKGVTLSGGQKARVSLARALYSRAPILLLDCPLSGLDKEVGHKVFFDAIKIVSQQRLVVMVTHQLDLLPHSDHLLVLQNGSLIFSGSFNQLKSSKDVQDILVALRKYNPSSKFVGNSGCLCVSDLLIASTGPSQAVNDKRVTDTKQTIKIILPKDVGEGDIGSSNDSLWQLYWEYNRACGLSTSMLGLSLCFAAYALSAWSDWMLSYLADSDTRHTQQYFFIIYLILSAFVLCNNISRYVLAAFNGISGSRSLHEALTTSVMSAPLQFFDTIPSGRVISRFSSDMNIVDDAIPSSLTSSYDAFLGVVTGLVVIVIKSPLFLFLLFPLAYQYLHIQRMYRKASVDLKRLDSSAKSPVFSHFNETLSGLEYIRAYQIQPAMIAHHRESLDRSITTRFNWDGVNRWMGIRLDLIGALIISGAAYSLLLIDTSSVKGGGGSAGLMVSYAMKSTASLNLAVRTSTALENMLLSLSRVLEYIQIPPELEFPADMNSSLSQQCDDHCLDEGDLESLPLLQSSSKAFMERPLHLVGKDISVRYHPSLPIVLKSISFELRGSKIVGLSGRTGGGKSTLAKVIARAIGNEYPTPAISLNGQSIYAVPLREYRATCVNLFPQDSYLFSGSIREVVDPHGHHSAEVILTQLKKFSQVIFPDDSQSTLVPSISHLSSLEYEVIANGGNLSAGEKQILTLVRASLSEARVVILDEITSNMSIPAAEIAIRMLRTDLVERRHTGILLICHRPADIVLCDEVYRRCCFTPSHRLYLAVGDFGWSLDFLLYNPVRFILDFAAFLFLVCRVLKLQRFRCFGSGKGEEQSRC